MTEPRDVIVYYADPLPGDRALLKREVWIGGECVESATCGSPAPIASVREHVRTVALV